MSKKVLVPLANGFEEIEFVSIVDTLRRAQIEVLIAGVSDECGASNEDSASGGSGAKSSSAVANGTSGKCGASVGASAKDSANGVGRIYTGAHGIAISADATLDSLDSSALAGFDGVALAGGWQGMLNLKASQKLREILREFKSQGKLVSAICASPIVLDAAGVLEGKFACYPSCEKFAYEDASADSGLSGSAGSDSDSSEGVNAGADSNRGSGEDKGAKSASAGKSPSDTPKTTEKPLNGTYQPKASVVREGNLITAAGPATGVLFALEIIAYLLGQAQSQSIAEQMLIPYLNHSAEILRS